MYEIFRCLSSTCKAGTNLTEHVVNALAPMLVDFFVFGLLIGIGFYCFEQIRMKRISHQVEKRLLSALDYFLSAVLEQGQTKTGSHLLSTKSGDIPLAFGGFSNSFGSNFVFADDATGVVERLQQDLQLIISVYAGFVDYRKLDSLFTAEQISASLHDQLALSSAASLSDASSELKRIRDIYSKVYDSLNQA